MKSFSFLWIVAGIVLLIGAMFGLNYLSSVSADSGAKIISKDGLHWHSTMAMVVKGEKQDLPANIGIFPNIHFPIHTHDIDNVIHMEFGGVVRERDLAIKVLFKNWGKTIADFGSLTKVLVNGTEESKGLEYIMRDGDKIELRFE